VTPPDDDRGGPPDLLVGGMDGGIEALLLDAGGVWLEGLRPPMHEPGRGSGLPSALVVGMPST
jgi:hypothetical protein